MKTIILFYMLFLFSKNILPWN